MSMLLRTAEPPRQGRFKSTTISCDGNVSVVDLFVSDTDDGRGEEVAQVVKLFSGRPSLAERTRSKRRNDSGRA
jgi:hypothetical protein